MKNLSISIDMFFQGNRVRDQDYNSAIFQDLGSSPATQDASKACDFMGCRDGYEVEQADAEQAYIQATLKGPDTWVLLPVEHMTDRMKKMKRPVVRLKLQVARANRELTTHMVYSAPSRSLI